LKGDDLPAEQSNHASDLMGPPFPQDQRGSPRAIDFELGRSSRTIFSSQQKSFATASNRIFDKLAVELDSISLRGFSCRMGQSVNELTVRRQDEQARSGAVESASDEQRSATERLRQQVGDQRRFAIIVAAGVSDRLVEQKILAGRR
jgi:hypothetical protein